jgi:KUP system potassium uptake protein
LKPEKSDSFWGGVIKAMGLVFGDIGTSPIYTLTVVFVLTKPTPDNVLGVLSLVVWTMTILVTVEYALLAMSLNNKGQGGEIVLREILFRVTKSSRILSFGGMITFIGVSLLIGDGVITPAISILSAVEGIELIPGFSSINQNGIIMIAAGIAVALFIFQPRGTDRIAWTFGPIMLIWFLTLAVSGLISLLTMPQLIKAVSPYYAVKFFQDNGISAFFVLSEVILCATGGEALYADMGHLGRKPILRAWHFVFFALLLSYLGQGAFILSHPETRNTLFGMIRHQASFLYIPFLILTVAATIIASQAIISGVFSIVYQGITTRLMPLMKIKYTSTRLRTQIYIGAVNWLLMIAVILILLIFKRSENLAAAYGMAVTGSMTVTAIMMTLIFSRIKKWKAPIAAIIVLIDMIYLYSTFDKFAQGAYWSLIIASIPLLLILIWTNGQRFLFNRLRPLSITSFLVSYEQIYAKGKNIAGTAIFFTRQWDTVPPYVIHCIIGSQIIYETNIFISITVTDEPFGVVTDYRKGVGTGLDVLEIKSGYMEVIDVEKYFLQYGIQEKIIFYGVEDITTFNPIWRIFSVVKKLSPNFVQFHKLPARKLHGVITRVEM